MNDEAEWRDAVIDQRLLLFVEGAAVGPALHINRGRVSDIQRPETDDYFAITAEGPFRDRKVTFLGNTPTATSRCARPAIAAVNTSPSERPVAQGPRSGCSDKY